MGKKEMIQKTINERKQWLLMKRFIKKLPDDFEHETAIWICDSFEIRIRKIEELHKLRKELRQILGSWEDKVIEIFPFGGNKVSITWEGSYQGIGIKIEYYCTEDTMPEGIIKPGCSFVKEQQTCTKFVCDIRKK